jgi:hypothetical protein
MATAAMRRLSTIKSLSTCRNPLLIPHSVPCTSSPEFLLTEKQSDVAAEPCTFASR